MATYSVHQVPRLPASDPRTHTWCSRGRVARLRSLQSDPGSFISRYESEAAESFEFFLSRFTSPVAHHLAVVADDSQLEDTLDQEWVGFCVLLSSEGSPEYHLAAVWVDPSVRGHGLGTRMVQAAIDLARSESVKAGTNSPHCSTSVVHGNESAAELYKRLGFRVVDENQTVEKEGRTYSTIEMRMDFVK